MLSLALDNVFTQVIKNLDSYVAMLIAPHQKFMLLIESSYK